MGNCLQGELDMDDKWKAEIPKASAVAPASPIYEIPKEVKNFRLFGDPMCPLTMQILLALRHKGVQYECSWLKNDFKEAKLEWSERNGSATVVPVLQHGTNKISGHPDTILQYIDANYPERSLIPKGELARYVQVWAIFLRDTLSPLVSQLLYDGEPSIQQELAPELDLAFSNVNEALSKFCHNGPYFFGNVFTLADVLLIPAISLMDPLEHFRGIDIGAAHQCVLAYKKNMASFPVYAAAKVTPESLRFYVANKLERRAPPPLLILMLMQHRSILSHFERLVILSDELVGNLGNKTGTPRASKMAEPNLRKLWKGYGRLVDLMQEHAQMEERVIFPALEECHEGIYGSPKYIVSFMRSKLSNGCFGVTDILNLVLSNAEHEVVWVSGVTDGANADHGRDLPVTNGVKEDLKGLLALDQGSSDYNEAILALANRLRTLQLQTQEHFQGEEKGVHTFTRCSCLCTKQERRGTLCDPLFGCNGVNTCTPVSLLLSGLNPQDIYQYMMVLHGNLWETRPSVFTRMLYIIRHSDDEFQTVRKLVQERFSDYTPFQNTAAGA